MSLFYPLPLFIFNPLLYSIYIVFWSRNFTGSCPNFYAPFSISLSQGKRQSLLPKVLLILSVAGVVFIFLSKGANFGSGTASWLCLDVGICSPNAINNILSKAKGGRYRAMDMTAVVIFVGFVTFNTLSLTSHYLDGSILAYVEPLGKLPYLLSLLYLRILASIVTGSLSIYAIVRLGASTVSVFGNLRNSFDHSSWGSYPPRTDL